VFVQPVVGLRQTDGALAHAEEARPLILATAYGVPVPLEEEHAAPGVEPARHQRGLVIEQIFPGEAGTLEEVDL